MQGGWADDLKQGLGKKVYANGDVYEGLWKGGKCEGPGRYRWRNNNEYDGEWKAGRMHGRGTLKWHTGGLRTFQKAFSNTGARLVLQEQQQPVCNYAHSTQKPAQHLVIAGIGLFCPLSEAQ